MKVVLFDGKNENNKKKRGKKKQSAFCLGSESPEFTESMGMFDHMDLKPGFIIKDPWTMRAKGVFDHGTNVREASDGHLEPKGGEGTGMDPSTFPENR